MSDSLYKALPDSLRPKNKIAVTDKNKMRIILNTSEAFIQTYYDEVYSMTLQLGKGIERVKVKSDKMLYAEAIGGFYMQTGNSSNAFEWYKKITVFGAEKVANRHLLSNAYINLSRFCSIKNKPDSAVIMLHAAMDVARIDNDSASIQDIYYSYVPIYTKFYLYPKAIIYLDKYMESTPREDKWKDTYTEAYLYKANLYRQFYEREKNSQYADSVKVVVREIMLKKKEEASFWYFGCYVTLGFIYYAENNYKEALHYFDAALLPKYTKPGFYMAALKYRIILYRGACLVQMGKATGVSEMLSAEIPPKDFKTKQLLNNVLYQYYNKKGDYKKALDHHTQYKVYSDSLDIIGQKGKIFEAEQKYSVAQKEAAIATLETKNLQATVAQKRTVVIAVFIGLLLVIVALLLYLNNKRQQVRRQIERQKLIDELAGMETGMELDRLRQQAEKEAAIIGQRQAISKNMHDELSSDLAALYYFIRDLKDRVKTEEAQQVLIDVEDETRTVYEQSRDFMHRLNKGDDPEIYSTFQLLTNLSLRFNLNSGLQIHTEVDSALEQKLTPKQNTELYKVIKEAVTNCLKHSGATRIDIQLGEQGEFIEFDIRDNGRGMGIMTGNGLGMTTIRERIESLGGKLSTTSSTAGLHIHGSFPKAA